MQPAPNQGYHPHPKIDEIRVRVVPETTGRATDNYIPAPIIRHDIPPSSILYQISPIDLTIH
jgi:hypothetical protein